MVETPAGDRRGFAVAEWTVAVLLLFVLVGLSARLIGHLTHVGFTQLRTAEWEQQATLAANILRLELRRGRSGTDWTTHSGDSVTLRAFRGTGWVCGPGTQPTTTVSVVFAGDRLPNPKKDSVLVLDAEGGLRALPLRGRQVRGSCPGVPLIHVEEWDLGPSPPSEAVLRLFESGSYSVSSGALRYRVGRGGRQPVVGSTFDTASSLKRSSMGVPGGEAATLFLAEPVGPYRSLPRVRRIAARARRSPP